MKVPMKHWRILAVSAAALALSAFAAAQELPSAPSAVKQQQSAPAAQAPAPTPQATAPAQSTAPKQAAPTGQSAPSTPTAEQNPAASPAGNNGDQEPGEGQSVTTIKTTVNEVNLVFTVVDKHGRFVKNLKKDDLKILDDNKPPKQIVSFSSETDLPLRVGLLVDASNSIRDRFKFEQEAAIEFLNQIVRPKSDSAFVLGFDSTAEVTQDFTDSTEKLSHGVRQLRPGGGTALFDAVYYACRDKLAKSQSQGPTRRAIIVLSDGEDNQSRVTREEAIEMAQRAEVIVYAISTNVSGIKTRGDKVLERFAETTGGRLFTPFKLQDVADAFTEIQDELRSQYALSYKPADFAADGRYRTIAIEAENHKNLRVRARKGYYAPKQ